MGWYRVKPSLLWAEEQRDGDYLVRGAGGRWRLVSGDVFMATMEASGVDGGETFHCAACGTLVERSRECPECARLTKLHSARNFGAVPVDEAGVSVEPD